MARLSRVLRSVEGGYAHWCPACKCAHIYYVRDRRPRWSFNGNVERPSFTPSMRIFTPARAEERDADGTVWPAEPERTICHYFVTDGEIRFCGDSAHELAGKTVPLPDAPGDDEYGWP